MGEHELVPSYLAASAYLDSLTDQFGPVTAMPSPGQIGVAGLVLSLALLGMRTYIRGLSERGGILDELLGRIVYISVLSMVPRIISQAIDLE